MTTYKLPANLHNEMIAQAATFNKAFAEIIADYTAFSVITRRRGVNKFEYKIVLSADLNEGDRPSPYAGWCATSLAHIFQDNEPDVALAFLLSIYAEQIDRAKCNR